MVCMWILVWKNTHTHGEASKCRRTLIIFETSMLSDVDLDTAVYIFVPRKTHTFTSRDNLEEAIQACFWEVGRKNWRTQWKPMRIWGEHTKLHANSNPRVYEQMSSFSLPCNQK